MLADYHVHSSFSEDCDTDMEEIVIEAINKGLDEICFTDHVDYGVRLDYGQEGYVPNVDLYGHIPRNVDYPAYFKKLDDLQHKYDQKIKIRKGLEFGIQMEYLKEYEALYEKYPLDFIIHSNHQVADIEIYLPEYFAGHSQQEYNRLYYEEILRTVKAYKHYSVLGHLDSIVRYDPKGPIDIREVEDLVRAILETVIADGKGIELNTSNVRYGLSDLTPCRHILKMYHELGGTIITIGSDAHKKEHLAFNILKSRQELKDLGFEYYCTFEKMVPVFHKL